MFATAAVGRYPTFNDSGEQNTMDRPEASSSTWRLPNRPAADSKLPCSNFAPWISSVVTDIHTEKCEEVPPWYQSEKTMPYFPRQVMHSDFSLPSWLYSITYYIPGSLTFAARRGTENKPDHGVLVAYSSDHPAIDKSTSGRAQANCKVAGTSDSL